MEISEETIDEFSKFLENNLDDIVKLINNSRESLSEEFEQEIKKVNKSQVRKEIEEIKKDRNLSLNIAGLYKIGKSLEVKDDYSGIIVDEIIGKNLASAIAEKEPRKTLAEATFHYMDIHYDEGKTAGEDDVIAGIAAGIQTRLKGWEWQEDDPP